MPRKAGFTGKPEDWLRRAKGNLAKVFPKSILRFVCFALCFDAQQAAENP